MAGIVNRGTFSQVLENMKELKEKYGENTSLKDIVEAESHK
jgi:hypothetical protein